MQLDEAIQQMRQAQTNAANYDLDTDDIVKKLQEWTKKCDFTVEEVDHDRVEIRFNTLPEDLTAFCKDVYAFCPDTIDQGYGCFADMIDAAAELGAEVHPSVMALADGVDLEDDDYGLELMERDLPNNMRLTLWWD